MATVGELVGYLRLDTAEWDQKADKAKAKIDELAAKSPTVKVQADTAAAIAKLEAVRAATLKVSAAEMALTEAQRKHGEGSRQALSAESALIGARNAATAAALKAANAEKALGDETDKDNKLHYTFREQLYSLAATLGTGLVPVLAAATAATVGLAAAGGVALLGFLGIREAMQAGTILGKQYTQALSPIMNEFASLKQLAAQSMFAGINQAVKETVPAFGQVNGVVATFGTQIGTAVATLVPGLIAVFRQLNPIFAQTGSLLIQGAAAFTNWAKNSTGVTTFVQYAVQQLPVVLQTLGALVQTFVKLAEAAGPMGGAVLQGLRAFAEIIDKMPIGVLQVLVPLVLGLNQGMKLLGFVQGVGENLDKFSGALGGVAVKLGLVTIAEDGAAVSARALVMAFLPLIGIAGGVIGGFEILKSTVGDVSVAGIKLGDILSNHVVPSSHGADDAMNSLNSVYSQFHNGVQGSNTQLLAFAQSMLKQPAVMSSYALSANDLTKDIGQLKGQIGQTGAQVIQTSGGLQVMTQTLRHQIKAVVDASGQNTIFNNVLNQLSGYAINSARAELQLKDALGTTADHFKAARDQAKQYGTSLDENTVKGRANREWLLNEISAVNQHASAVMQQTGSVKAATGALSTDEAQLRSAAKAAGFNKDQVNDMIKKYEAVPGKVQTQVALETANALNALEGFEARLAFLSHTITIDVYANLVGINPLAYQGKHAAGGFLTGPGTGTSDSMLIAASTGEFVMNANATTKFRPMLEAMNASVPAFAGGGSPVVPSGMAVGAHVTVVNMTVQGSIRSDHDVVSMVEGVIDNKRRWRGDVGLVDSRSGQWALQQVPISTADTAGLM